MYLIMKIASVSPRLKGPRCAIIEIFIVYYRVDHDILDYFTSIPLNCVGTKTICAFFVVCSCGCGGGSEYDERKYITVLYNQQFYGTKYFGLLLYHTIYQHVLNNVRDFPKKSHHNRTSKLDALLHESVNRKNPRTMMISWETICFQKVSF